MMRTTRSAHALFNTAKRTETQASIGGLLTQSITIYPSRLLPYTACSALPTHQRRCHIHSPPIDSRTSSSEPGGSTIYLAPYRRAVRLVKAFSFFSLASTYAVTPLFYVLRADNSSLPFISAVVLTAVTFSTTSTALIHFVLKSYVGKIMSLPPKEKGKVAIETFSVTGKSRTSVVEAEELEWVESAWARTWKDTRSGRVYFVHKELLNEWGDDMLRFAARVKH